MNAKQFFLVAALTTTVAYHANAECPIECTENIECSKTTKCSECPKDCSKNKDCSECNTQQTDATDSKKSCTGKAPDERVIASLTSVVCKTTDEDPSEKNNTVITAG